MVKKKTFYWYVHTIYTYFSVWYDVDSVVHREYQIGVDICRGQDQYKSTRIVTFVAYYQLENKTPYKLAYLQRHLLADEVGLPLFI